MQRDYIHIKATKLTKITKITLRPVRVQPHDYRSSVHSKGGSKEDIMKQITHIEDRQPGKSMKFLLWMVQELSRQICNRCVINFKQGSCTATPKASMIVYTGVKVMIFLVLTVFIVGKQP